MLQLIFLIIEILNVKFDTLTLKVIIIRIKAMNEMNYQLN